MPDTASDKSRPRITVFAGPCLAGVSRRDPCLRGVDLLPPAQRGDVLALLAEEPDVIVLLDGYFFTVPAVTHKEIVYALDAGVRVIGAASMGALRAAELGPQGMHGCGHVFRWFRDGELDGDDEVALLHAGAEDGYRQISVALVEVRWALRQLAEDLEPAATTTLIEDLKKLCFTQRYPETVLDLARRHLGSAATAKLEHELDGPGIKQRDALEAIALARGFRRRRSATNPAPVTAFLNAFRESCVRPRVPTPTDATTVPTLVQVCQTFQLLHPQAAEFVRHQRRRFLAASAADLAGIDVAATAVAAAEARLRQHLQTCYGGQPLVALELREEATEQARAVAACERFGSFRGAMEELARRFGLQPADAEHTLVEILEREPKLYTAWALGRSFVFTTAFEKSFAVATAALEIFQRFEKWAQGSRIAVDDLRTVAAELWDCQEHEVPLEATRRSLFEGDGTLAGFRDAVELIAPAERLRPPFNDYPELRSVLRRSPVRHALELSGGL